MRANNRNASDVPITRFVRRLPANYRMEQAIAFHGGPEETVQAGHDEDEVWSTWMRMEDAVAS